MKLIFSKTKPPLGGIIAAEYAKIIQHKPLEITWGEETIVEGVSCETGSDVARIVARVLAEPQLYGNTALEKTEVDHWLTFSIGPLAANGEFPNAVQYLNKVLGPLTFLVGRRLTIADLVVFSALYVNKQWLELLSKKSTPPNVLRWYNFIKSQEAVTKALASIPEEVRAALIPQTSARQSADRSTGKERKEEGKFVDLPGAEMGKVIVRFPPEASGYLHIGHAKAALLNQYYQQAFQGKLIMRFDDTNPAKENVHFEQVILEDVDMLEIKPDLFTHTSSYFDLMLELCEKLIKEGKAYVDDTEAELMKQQREQRIESANRTNSVEKNLALWGEMMQGTEKGQKCCVRAKIDMQSANGCMRDPTIYRCKNEVHPRTGDKYKVYPTYDFACPIVDAIEGVTHVLRTMEYHDRDPQFFWFIEALGLRKPYIWEYSRLSMTNTVLSKRKLTWFVDNKLVDGWDDARMPTVRGVLRRGMTVEGLKQFIIAQGSSRSVVFMEWDKIWAFNKKVIDPIAPRYTSVDLDNVPVFVKNAKEEALTVPKHPKNAEVGNKETWVGPKILIDRVDAEQLKEGENATFINWGNLLIKKIKRDNGTVTSIEAEPNLENKDYKKTLKLTWLAETEKASFTPTWCVYFDHIISKPLLGKDEDFKQFVNKDTRKEIQMLGDPELKKLKQGDIIQLQRRGFFRVDVAYQPHSLYTTKETPVVLFYVPDGHTKENPAVSAAVKQPANKEATAVTKSPEALNEEITKQGDLVRNLKAQKAAKADIDSAVKGLLALKSDYKSVTGQEWKPGASPPKSAANEAELLKKIAAQGDKVRELKTKKAEKSVVDEAVKVLLQLKGDYKALTGQDWKPGTVVKNEPEKTSQSNTALDDAEILNKIAAQGDKVRELKSKKAEKSAIDEAVKVLLQLKGDYKALTGQDWKPGAVPKNQPEKLSQNSTTLDDAEILNKIATQGDKVRELKAKKAEKSVIDEAVKVLLQLKADYKALTGQDWKPGTVPKKAAVSMAGGPAGDDPKKAELIEKVNAQGNVVRELKAKKGSKEEIDAAVKTLLDLKAEYKTYTGTDFPAPGKTPSKPAKEAKPAAAPKEKPSKQKAAIKEKRPVDAEESGVKKQTRLGLEAKKEESLSDWYSEVITKGELIEYYDVSGCYILRHWSYAIWESIQSFLDKEFKKLGVKNCYFPIFVSRSVLEKEKTHIADFAPEVAWVTKSGDSDLAEPIAVRPTSETVMYPAYAKWIRSYRDLPLKFNQWNNVVRWEFKHPQPFIRTREFLWQEGHTAYASKEDAEAEVKVVLELYAHVYTDLLAVPVVKGKKTEKEKFAGGDYTLTTEAYISASGRAIQGATSHHLGQNFSKMFEVVYEDPKTREKEYVYQNSWGMTTRTIGVMILVHADNQGLVLPPKIASIQVVIVPCGITVNLSEEAQKQLQDSCTELENQLKSADIRVEGDYRENYSPGWKFNHWELKGVPIRVELGPKDLEKKQLVAVRRDTGEKITISRENATEKLTALLNEIQQNLYTRACKELSDHLVTLKDWSQFSPELEKKNIILAPFCGDISCEEKIKADSARDDDAADPGAPSMGAKSLCIPFDQPAAITQKDRCIHPQCNRTPQFYTLFGRSY